MTAPISPLIHALRLLKAELAQARHSPSQRQATAGASAGLVNRAAPPAAVTALQGLTAKLKAARAQGGAIPRAKALRLFVEAALLDELGGELQLDPALEGLVERTCRAIEQDAGSAALLDEALQELQALVD
ncbi:hypothetical protein [Pelomonas sp. Root1237]|uniref:hypothetical protein n=1 Tax=Pelomonas sp. Root1237 TaxID=1736434 RepID=UPI0006F7C3EC|nr:hypothetical protein [Pelomonas sp. Root1237]KQV92104.1 hypothetical protein ASC91_05770 [Pelomonas sp. Root1237]